jgi:selenocysteine lyase/cysteine desulfurase
MERRSFIKNLGSISGTTALFGAYPLMGYTDNWEYNDQYSPSNDEDFWRQVQMAYTASANIINLNNGGVSPQPKVVQETFEHYNRLCNEAPSYYMWRVLDQAREALRTSLAELAGCEPGEISINRNTTEALDTVIFGIKLERGDEVVLTRKDYPNVRNAWNWRGKRDGIKLNYIDIPLPSESEEGYVKAFTDRFTDKTRVVQLTHMIHYTGQILPVRKIADEARKRNILVVCDGAHTFAHFDYKIPDLGCDYYGTSLHKWLCAPFGTGMLYVRKELIAGLAPLFPGDYPESDDIRKFEALGTRSFPSELATGRAIDFHLGIGARRKQERLHYLKHYWAEQALKIDRVKLHTSLKPEWSGALALFSIDGKTPAEIETHLFKKKGIHSVGIEWENISGIRITPHVYTTTANLDRLLEGIDELSKS